MEHQYVPPTLHLTTPDPACDLDYVAREGRLLDIRRALINSFGFGGKNIVLAMSHVGATVPQEVPVGNAWGSMVCDEPVGVS